MKHHPIIMSAESVRAILDGRKTQTRRIVKPQPEPIPDDVPRVRGDTGYWWRCSRVQSMIQTREMAQSCPYGVPGDRLWVRETWAWPGEEWVLYRADGWAREAKKRADADPLLPPITWRSPIYMPRRASRITLEITDVRVERVQEISEADARAEGATSRPGICGYQSRDPGWSMDWTRVGQMSRWASGRDNSGRKFPLQERDICLGSARMAYANLWDSINAKRGYPWESNPWAWAITFKRAQP